MGPFKPSLKFETDKNNLITPSFSLSNKNPWKAKNVKKASSSTSNNFSIAALPTFTFKYATSISEPTYYPVSDGTIYELNVYSYSAIYYGEDQPWSIDTIRVNLYTKVQRFFRDAPGGPLKIGPWQEWQDDNTGTNSYFADLSIYFYGFIPYSNVLIYDKWYAMGRHYYRSIRFNIKEWRYSEIESWVPYQPTNQIIKQQC